MSVNHRPTIDPERREIRLLVLQPGVYSAALRCSLLVVSLNDELNYEALSYAWGSSEDPSFIEVDSITTPVTQNLEIALRHLRFSTAERCLWIDALCINQEDVAERGSQVTMMGSIYRSAEHVLVWIGVADEVSDIAFDWMPKIDISFVDHEDAPEVWSFYINATKRPYMRRVSWSVFMSAYKILSLEFFTEADMVQDDAEGRMPEVLAKLKYDLFDELRTTFQQDGGADLRQLLIMSRTSESTEPRDRIYGLLQMLDDEDKKHFDVDYTKPVAEIYTEAMSLIFKQGDGPHFLGSMWCPSKYNPLAPGLPSWVPDFSNQTAKKASPVPLSNLFHPAFPRSASGPGAEADNGTVLDDLKTLKVEALPVDAVQDVLSFGSTVAECIRQLDEVEDRAKAASLRLIHNERLRPFFDKFRSSEPLWRTLVSNKKYGSGYHVSPGSYEITFQQLRLQEFHNVTDASVDGSEYIRAIEAHLPSRTFFTTKNGLIGIGMPAVKQGDEVTIWFGATVPFVVRPCEYDTTKHRLIGAAYVAGIMEGQLVDELYCEDLLDSKTLLVI